MEISIVNPQKAEVFVQIFQNMKALTNAISIMLREKQFYVQGMDSSHVSMFELALDHKWFDSYKVEKDVVLGINIDIFAKILGTHKNSQKIILYQTHEDRLDISFQSDDKEFNKDFSMPLVEIDNELMNITDFDFDLEFIMESKRLKQTVDEMLIFGDNVKIDFNDDKIVLKVENETTGNMNTYIDVEDLEECTISDDDDISCSFNIKYMQFMSNYFKVSKNVHLKFSKSYPMMCKYILDGMSDTNYIRFYLAPKIQDD